MQKASLFLTLMIGLGGCQAGPGEGYPNAARQMLKAPLPADGKLHVQRKGVFDIRANTNFCTYRPGFGLDGRAVREALARLGPIDDQVVLDQANGSFGLKSTPECRKPQVGNPVFARGEDGPNRDGQPYKMTLAVWQGSAVWVGAIERPNGLRSDAIAQRVPVNDGPGFFRPTQSESRNKARQKHAMQLDRLGLARTFFRDVAEKSK